MKRLSILACLLMLCIAAWGQGQPSPKPGWQVDVQRFGALWKNWERTLAKNPGLETLRSRSRLIAELWRIRESIRLASLLEPEMVESLTGLDVAEFRRLAKMARSIRLP
jgi:hypothetical protein